MMTKRLLRLTRCGTIVGTFICVLGLELIVCVYLHVQRKPVDSGPTPSGSGPPTYDSGSIASDSGSMASDNGYTTSDSVSGVDDLHDGGRALLGGDNNKDVSVGELAGSEGYGVDVSVELDNDKSINITENGVIDKGSAIRPITPFIKPIPLAELKQSMNDLESAKSNINRSGIYSTVFAAHEDVQRILGKNSDIENRTQTLLKLLKPALADRMQNTIVEEFDALIAVLWKLFCNKTTTMFTPIANMTVAKRKEYATNQSEILQTIDCTNIQLLNIQAKLGHGVYKVGYKADFLGTDVILKVARDQHYPRDDCDNYFSSYVKSNVELLSEVFVLKGVSHPMFGKIYGHCIHNGINISGVVFPPGVMAVHELGTAMPDFEDMSYKDMLKYAVYVADFLDYAENSPLGRLVIGDFKLEQFFMVGSRIILADYHMIDRLEEPDFHVEKHHNLTGRRYRSRVSDYKYNFYSANLVFFQHLLRAERYPVILRPVVTDIGYAIGNYSINASELHERLNNVYHKYINGTRYSSVSL